jgi:hypothetical protein
VSTCAAKLFSASNSIMPGSRLSTGNFAALAIQNARQTRTAPRTAVLRPVWVESPFAPPIAPNRAGFAAWLAAPSLSGGQAGNFTPALAILADST